MERPVLGQLDLDSLSAADFLCDVTRRDAAHTLARARRAATIPLKPIMGALLTCSAAAVILVGWSSLYGAAAAIVPILWTLAPLLLVHAIQIALSTAAWSKLLSPARFPAGFLFQLRVIREGVDTMFPLAQVGGEMIASSALVRSGIAPAVAAGSIMIDMGLELIGQLGFLMLGCLLLSGVSQGEAWSLGLSLAGTMIAVSACLLAADRFGALNLVEALLARLSRHVTPNPALAISGLQAHVSRMLARRHALGGAILLHFLHWLLGALEVLIVLRAMGLPASPAQAIIMNTIGIAARSAGFLVPGALVVQESGFMLGAALAGLPPHCGLAFSMMRRLRELAIGGAGILLWRAGLVSAAAA